MNETITLTINKEKIQFNVDFGAQEKLVNEMRPDQKVAPMHNFLIRTVTPETKEALKPFLKVPLAVVQICEKVLEGYLPQFDLSLGE